MNKNTVLPRCGVVGLLMNSIRVLSLRYRKANTQGQGMCVVRITAHMQTNEIAHSILWQHFWWSGDLGDPAVQALHEPCWLVTPYHKSDSCNIIHNIWKLHIVLLAHCTFGRCVTRPFWRPSTITGLDVFHNPRNIAFSLHRLIWLSKLDDILNHVATLPTAGSLASLSLGAQHQRCRRGLEWMSLLQVTLCELLLTHTRCFTAMWCINKGVYQTANHLWWLEPSQDLYWQVVYTISVLHTSSQYMKLKQDLNFTWCHLISYGCREKAVFPGLSNTSCNHTGKWVCLESIKEGSQAAQSNDCSSGGVAHIVSVTMSLLIYKRPCSCYFPPEQGLLRITHRYKNKGWNRSRLFVGSGALNWAFQEVIWELTLASLPLPLAHFFQINWYMLSVVAYSTNHFTHITDIRKYFTSISTCIE